MKIDELVKFDTRALLAAYAAGTISPVEVMRATLDQSENVNPALCALFHIVRDEALIAAHASEGRWRRREPNGALDGVPVTVKDGITVIGWPYRHGARPNSELPPSTEDAPPVARLKEAGAIIFAKTTMPDCGLLGSGVSSAHGIARNPWRLSTNTGGSSSGAGASLAAGVGLSSVGSDIAGSVRLPAGHCGLVALKPTQGLIPHLSMDIMRSAGPMARTVLDAAALLDVIARPDSRDAWSLPPGPHGFAERLERDLRGVTVGLLLDMGFGPKPTPEVAEVIRLAARRLESAGARIVEVAPPYDDDPYEAVDHTFKVRGYAEILAMPADRRGELTQAVAQWAYRAKDFTAVDFVGFLRATNVSRARLEAHLRPYDYVLSPILPVVNFPAEAAGLFEDLPLRHANFTAMFNQTAQPAAAVPQAFVDGLPVGAQVVGRRFDDLGVLQVCHFLEQARGPIDWPLTPRA